MDPHRSSVPALWLLREATFALSDQEKFLFAETLSPDTDIDAFLDNYSHTLVFRLLHEGIDESRLRQQLEKDARLVGTTVDFSMHEYHREKQAMGAILELESALAKQAPALAKVFTVGQSAVRSAENEAQQNQDESKKIRALALTLLDDRVPSSEACEASLARFQETHTSLGWGSPLMQMSSIVAMGCASARNDPNLAGAGRLHLSKALSSFGPYSYAITKVNQYLLEQANTSGRAPMLQSQAPLASGHSFILDGRTRWGYETAQWHPLRGPMQVKKVSQVS